MNNEDYGLLLRVYAKTPEDVNKIVERAITNVILAVNLDIFSNIIVLVPKDYDCGMTAKTLSNKLQEQNIKGIVFEIPGHHSSEALNETLSEFHWTIDNVVIISGKAMPYLTAANMNAADEAFSAGAMVVGVVVNELENIILSGRVQNTFAVWKLEELLSLGGFQTNLDVEEIDPLVKLIQINGKCIAILDPEEKPKLNIRKSKDGIARHNEVMTTKLKNQQIEVDRLSVDFDFIKNGIMEGYPKKI